MRFVNPVAAALLVAVLAVGRPWPAAAVVVDGLYEGVGAGDVTDAGRAAAATDALRQVVVRVTGRRAAASDPALAAIYSDATRLARTFRSAERNQVIVEFDAAALDARLLQAGQRLWSRDRPLTLALLVDTRPGAVRSLGGAGDADTRRAVTAAAQLRGLPLTWPGGLPAATEQARIDDALAARLEPLVELARQYGADVVLLGRVGAGASSWSWSGLAGEGTATGTADEAVQALADRLGAQYATATAKAGQLDVVVRGVRDLSAYAAASSALATVAGVRSVELEEASGESLRFRLGFDGDDEALKRAVRDAGRFVPDDAARPGGPLQLVLRP